MSALVLSAGALLVMLLAATCARVVVSRCQWGAPHGEDAGRGWLLARRRPQLLTIALPSRVPVDAWCRLVGALGELVTRRRWWRRLLAPAELALVRYASSGTVSVAIAVPRTVEPTHVVRPICHHLRGASVTEQAITTLSDGAIAGRSLRLVRPPWYPLATEATDDAVAAAVIDSLLGGAAGRGEGTAVVVTIAAAGSIRRAWLRSQGRRFLAGASTDVVTRATEAFTDARPRRGPMPEPATAHTLKQKLARSDRIVATSVRTVAFAMAADQHRRRQRRSLATLAGHVAADLCQLDASAEDGNRFTTGPLSPRAARRLGSVGPRMLLCAAEVAALTRPPVDPAATGLAVAPAPAVAPPQGMFGDDE